MKAISLFTGVGGFDLGFERAGIETVLQAERDPHCLKVLERHWPQTERVDDVRCVGIRSARFLEQRDSGELGVERRNEFKHPVDLVYGGFPCQDLSVAGKRAGLGGERSGLWFEFHRVLSELRPRWTVIENVPGLLSSNGGRDFGIVLDGLGELGYGVAWAVLDAQYFGVPQRRRRVFIVGCLGEPRRAQQVLSVCESCGGNPETGRTAGERVAYSLTAGVRGTGDGHGNAWNSNYVTAGAVTASAGHHGHSSPRGDGSDNLIAAPLGAHHRRDDLDHDTYIPDIVASVTAKWAKGSGGPAGDEIQDLVYAPSTLSTLSTLASGAHPGGLNGQEAESQTVVMRSGVRRLTPLECERLQGFPDGWTEGESDSHRYRQMGNAVCVPVAEWIGHRIVATEKARIATGLGSVAG